MSKWEKVKLEDICESSSSNISQKDLNKNSGIYPIYGAGGLITYIDYYKYECNYIAIVKDGAGIGRSYILPSKSSIISTLQALIPNNKIDINYLNYAITSLHLERNYTGTTIPHIYFKDYKKRTIHLPPLEEQHKIASILDTVSEALKLRKQQLSELDLLVKSKFVEMFGDPVENPMKWEYITLNDICDIGSSKRIYESEYVSNGIPFYRTKEIVELSKGNSISTELFISIKRFNEIKSKYSVPKKNDILISAVGTIGTIWVVDGKEDFYFKDGNLLLIKASNKFSSIYMSFLLENLIGHYKQELSSGTAYSALTIEKLKCMKAFNPPIELQNKFASFVERVDELKSEVQKSIDQLQTLFDSLMQEYFE